jgi:hypothetical protein
MAGVSREGRVERVRYWQGLIEEHSRSGLSVVEFCQERKIASTSFYQWRTKLLREAEPAASQVPAILPVKLVSAPVEQRKPAARSCIQVFTPSGLSLTISGSATEAELVKVLRAIDMAEAARPC